MKGRRFVYLAAGVFAAAGVLLLAGPAGAARQIHATNPACGSTMGTDVTLTGNMNCSGTNDYGLIAGANGITINLGGYTLTVDNNETGVDVEGYNNVTVENGTIEMSHPGGTNGYYGIYADDGNSNTFTNLTIENGEEGIEAEYETNDVVSGNTVRYNTDEGIYYEYGADNLIAGNVAHDNADEGIELDEETGTTVNSNYSQFSGDDNFYDDDSAWTTWSGNIATGAAYEGFDISESGYGAVSLINNGSRVNGGEGFYTYANFTSPYGDWYSVQAPYSTYSGNQSIYNGSYGWEAAYDWYATFKNNFASRNGDTGFYSYYPLGQMWSGNTSNYNTNEGFYISDNLTDGNSYPGNVSDFSGNTAMYNSDYGFDADYGVPGSGNTGGSSNTTADCYLVAGCS
jgi:parallel beta-helix repeat protein